jgi:C4-dicarboxylate-specific signal transduction histidine kinase
VFSNHRLNLAQFFLFLALALIFLFLIIVRPPVSYYALPLVPIAVAALLYEFAGGTLAALVVMIGIALVIVLDSDLARRAVMLRDIWPILIAYLIVGPFVGWFASREQIRDHEYARLLELEQARARALAAISEAGREIAASPDLARTLQLVITQAAETLPMDAGALFLLDENAQMHKVMASHNLAPDDINRITFSFHEGVPGWVVRNRRPLIVPDATIDSRVHPTVIEDGVKSVMAIPLIAREKVVGVLNLFYRTGLDGFDEESLSLAQVYADQAAIFIENARLVDELRQAAVELETRVEQRTQELRDTQAQVIRAEKLAIVGRLAASVAHEVNNPLQAIALHLQLVTEEGLSEVAEEQMVVVRQELDRIARIVQRLLEFQRPKQVDRTQQNITKLLDEVLALAGKQLQQKKVSVQRDEPETLAPILANGDQLKQVFLNLVLNAAEAMPGGGHLQISICQNDDNINLSFNDTGHGLTPKVMEHLFEPFFSARHEGTGLGLAVSHEIITAHNGTMSAANRAEGGATFTVDLPIGRSGE